MRIEPPPELSAKSKALWRAVVPRRVRAPEGLILLQLALQQLDIADEASDTIRREGATTKTLGSGVVHKHPAADVAKSARGEFFKLWEKLRLTWTPSTGHEAYHDEDLDDCEV